MFSQASVILLGVCGRHPPWADTLPPGRHPQADNPVPSACWDTRPPVQCMLGYTPPAHCMLGYTPLPSASWDTQPPPPPVATAMDGTHPAGIHSCLI